MMMHISPHPDSMLSGNTKVATTEGIQQKLRKVFESRGECMAGCLAG